MMDPADGRIRIPQGVFIACCHHHTRVIKWCAGLRSDLAASYLCWDTAFTGRVIVMLFEKRLKVGLVDFHIFQSEFSFCNCELSTDPRRLLLTLHRKDAFILSHSFFVG